MFPERTRKQIWRIVSRTFDHRSINKAANTESSKFKQVKRSKNGYKTIGRTSFSSFTITQGARRVRNFVSTSIRQNLRRMALWHIPLFQERSPLDTIFDDVFDMSFSPRYYRHFYIPYNKYHTKKNAGGGKSQGESFKISLDVRDYRPEDISLKVDGDKLLVKGKRCKESEFGYEKSEFDRTYPIPSDVDAEGFKSKLNDDGVLEIEAPKKVKQEELEAIVEPTQQDENKFKAIFDVTQYKPEEVSVKVQGNRVVIHGEQKSDSKDDDKEVFSHHRQFVRRIVLPETVKLDSLQSKWTKDGKLVIEADKIPTIEAECRQLEIKHECDEGSKAE